MELKRVYSETEQSISLGSVILLKLVFQTFPEIRIYTRTLLLQHYSAHNIMANRAYKLSILWWMIMKSRPADDTYSSNKIDQRLL